MKVYIGPYKDWIGPYQIARWLKYIGLSEERIDAIGEYLSETWVHKACQWFYDHNPRKVKVKIHDYDIWNMDATLSMIILPMLKILQEDPYGYPMVDDSDVPENIRSVNGVKDNEHDPDSLADDRWKWVLGEMVWAFEQIHPENTWEDQYYHNDEFDKEGYTKHQDKITNGLRLFGKYYQSLWT